MNVNTTHATRVCGKLRTGPHSSASLLSNYNHWRSAVSMACRMITYWLMAVKRHEKGVRSGVLLKSIGGKLATVCIYVGSVAFPTSATVLGCAQPYTRELRVLSCRRCS